MWSHDNISVVICIYSTVDANNLFPDGAEPASKASGEIQLARRLKHLTPEVRPVMDYNDTVIVDIAMALHALYDVVCQHCE